MSLVIEERVIDANGQVGVRRYRKGRFLGKGAFAKCFELISIETSRVFAAKFIPRTALEQAKSKLMSEIKIHRSLHHPAIVSFEHFFEDASHLYILLEHCPCHTLQHLLNRRGAFTECEVRQYALQLIVMLKFLRSRRVLHRAFQPSNLFLSQNMQLKVGDFALATQLNSATDLKHKVCGEPNYMSPEMLGSESGYSFESDLWALGVTLYTLLVGKPPFDAFESKVTTQRIKKLSYEFPEHAGISESAKHLISRIFMLDPAKRITLDELQQHEFFKVAVPRALSPAAPETLPPVEQLDTKRVLVEKWLDYSWKYGLGYLLTNGCVGVCFNDSSKLSVYNNRLMYLEVTGPKRFETISFYTEDQFPDSLAKKVSLLGQFREHLKDAAVREEGPSTYVKKCLATRHATVFRLSNNLVQVAFRDNTELILSTEKRSVSYKNHEGHTVTYAVKDAMDSREEALLKRLEYTKNLLAELLSRPKGPH